MKSIIIAGISLLLLTINAKAQELFPPNDNCSSLLQFDGQDDHIITNSGGSIFLNRDFTLEAWIYLESYSTGDYSIVFGNHPVDEQLYFAVCGESYGADKGKLLVKVARGIEGNASETQMGSTVLETNKWYHIAFTYDFTSTGNRANAEMYLNGISDGSWTNVADTWTFLSFSRTPLDDMYLGFAEKSSIPVANHFHGRMDEVRIWTDVRTAQEITETMDSSVVEWADNLSISFNFNEGKNSDKVLNIRKPSLGEGFLTNMDPLTSWIQLDGSVTQNTSSEISDFACFSYSAPSGAEYTSSGWYADVITNDAGCDSTVQIDLVVESITEPTAYIDDNTGNFRAGYFRADAYAWVKCSDPDGQVYGTEETFTPTETGEYQVKITDRGCTVSTNCLSFVGTSTSEINNDLSEINVYPNPVSENLTVGVGNTQEISSIEIYNIAGVLVNSIAISNQNNVVIQLNEKSGIYFIKVNSSNGTSATKKVIKL